MDGPRTRCSWSAHKSDENLVGDIGSRGDALRGSWCSTIGGGGGVATSVGGRSRMAGAIVGGVTGIVGRRGGNRLPPPFFGRGVKPTFGSRSGVRSVVPSKSKVATALLFFAGGFAGTSSTNRFSMVLDQWFLAPLEPRRCWWFGAGKTLECGLGPLCPVGRGRR